ncbi:hypothetical protein Slin14017_G128790 [Septoria linicola]|nr:hypothetical protein Slin14017_G128790 [Septoria linicola]
MKNADADEIDSFSQAQAARLRQMRRHCRSVRSLLQRRTNLHEDENECLQQCNELYGRLSSMIRDVEGRVNTWVPNRHGPTTFEYVLKYLLQTGGATIAEDGKRIKLREDVAQQDCFHGPQARNIGTPCVIAIDCNADPRLLGATYGKWGGHRFMDTWERALRDSRLGSRTTNMCSNAARLIHTIFANEKTPKGPGRIQRMPQYRQSMTQKLLSSREAIAKDASASSNVVIDTSGWQAFTYQLLRVDPCLRCRSTYVGMPMARGKNSDSVEEGDETVLNEGREHSCAESMLWQDRVNQEDR